MTVSAKPLTEIQQAALEVLRAAPGPVSARTVAEVLWPDDPGWQRRTRFYGANKNGALGATVWLRAGRVLSNLVAKGVVHEVGKERPVLYAASSRREGS